MRSVHLPGVAPGGAGAVVVSGLRQHAMGRSVSRRRRRESTATRRECRGRFVTKLSEIPSLIRELYGIVARLDRARLPHCLEAVQGWDAQRDVQRPRQVGLRECRKAPEDQPAEHLPEQATALDGPGSDGAAASPSSSAPLRRGVRLTARRGKARAPGGHAVARGATAYPVRARFSVGSAMSSN